MGGSTEYTEPKNSAQRVLCAKSAALVTVSFGAVYPQSDLYAASLSLAVGCWNTGMGRIALGRKPEKLRAASVEVS